MARGVMRDASRGETRFEEGDHGGGHVVEGGQQAVQLWEPVNAHRVSVCGHRAAERGHRVTEQREHGVASLGTRGRSALLACEIRGGICGCFSLVIWRGPACCRGEVADAFRGTRDDSEGGFELLDILRDVDVVDAEQEDLPLASRLPRLRRLHLLLSARTNISRREKNNRDPGVVVVADEKKHRCL
eukprot:1009346-Rhodomonas_salina.2